MAGEVMGDVMIGDVISDAIVLTVRRALLLSAARRRSSPVAVANLVQISTELIDRGGESGTNVPPDEVYNNGVHSCVRW